MKKFLFLVTFFMSVQLCAQQINVNNVPDEVILEFDRRFPDAIVFYWYNTGKNILVSFVNKGENAKAVFEENGKWINTFTYVNKTEIPEAAFKYYEKNYKYKGYVLSSYGFSQVAQGISAYQLNLSTTAQKGKITELYFNIDGEFIGSNCVDELNISTSKSPINGVVTYKNIEVPSIPEKIIDNIKANYRDFKIKQAASIIEGNYIGGYYIVIRRQGKTKSVELFYDKFGSLVDKIEPEQAIEGMNTSDNKPAEFNPKNYGISQTVKVKELPTLVIDYIKLNYYNYDIVYSAQLSQEGLQEVYHIKIKKQGDKKNITELYFDLYGNLLLKIEPVDKDNFLNNESQDNNVKEKNQEIQSASKTEISAKELPTPVTAFLRNNYRDAYIKKILFINNEEMKQVYFVELKRQADNPIELYFDFYGNLISNNDPVWKQKQEELALLKENMSPKLTINDIPEIVVKNFNKKYPKSTDVEWDKEDDNFLAKFTLNDQKAKASFTPNGQWIYSAMPYDKDRLSNIIKTYIDKNYGGYKIDYAMQVQRADKKNYYSVVLVRKIKGGKEYLGLKFNNSGKFLEVDDKVNPETGEQ